jgi:hypothetical protein
MPSLDFPKFPKAPDLPAMVNAHSCEEYARQFEIYHQAWDKANKRVMDHFIVRYMLRVRQRDTPKNHIATFPNGDDIIHYHDSLCQDNEIREKWLKEWEEHAVQLENLGALIKKWKSLQ